MAAIVSVCGLRIGLIRTRVLQPERRMADLAAGEAWGVDKIRTLAELNGRAKPAEI